MSWMFFFFWRFTFCNVPKWPFGVKTSNGAFPVKLQSGNFMFPSVGLLEQHIQCSSIFHLEDAGVFHLCLCALQPSSEHANFTDKFPQFGDRGMKILFSGLRNTFKITYVVVWLPNSLFHSWKEGKQCHIVAFLRLCDFWLSNLQKDLFRNIGFNDV